MLERTIGASWTESYKVPSFGTQVLTLQIFETSCLKFRTPLLEMDFCHFCRTFQQYTALLKLEMSRDSSFSEVTGYGLDDRGLSTETLEQGFFIVATASRQALGPTHPRMY